MSLIQFRPDVLDLLQSALDGELSLLEAAVSLNSILHADPTLAVDVDRNFIRGVDSEVDDLPLGPARNQWHPDFLPAKDTEIAAATELWHEDLLATFTRIRRTLLVRKLVFLGHVSVAERQRLGRVTRAEVETLLELTLRRNGVFPAPSPGPSVYEGATLTRTPNTNAVEITWTRHYATNPRLLAERHTSTYSDLSDAIAAFIASEWPHGIDGIPLDIG